VLPFRPRHSLAAFCFKHLLGEQCVLGALRALYGVPKGSDLERLVVRPFPRVEKANQQAQNTRHREDLIARCGVVVVLAGNRAQGVGIETSPGVLEEVEIGLRERKYIIPIGATGHAAREVWDRARAEPERFLPGIRGNRELAVLGDSHATNEQLLKALFLLLAKVEKAGAV
jgi:SLOG family protein